MRNYRSSAASPIRIDYGVALVSGLSKFDQTRAQSTAFKALNDELHAQFTARVALRKPWIEARQEVRFADYNAEQVIRTYQRVVEIADGGRRGPLSKDQFPGGVTPVLAPVGAAQLPALEELIEERVKKSRLAGMDALRTTELPKLEEARTLLVSAVDAYKAARAAYIEAFSHEKATRDEHRLAVTSLMGTVRSLFPGDTQLQDVIFPEHEIAAGLKDEGDDEDDGDDNA